MRAAFADGAVVKIHWFEDLGGKTGKQRSGNWDCSWARGTIKIATFHLCLGIPAELLRRLKAASRKSRGSGRPISPADPFPHFPPHENRAVQADPFPPGERRFLGRGGSAGWKGQVFVAPTKATFVNWSVRIAMGACRRASHRSRRSKFRYWLPQGVGHSQRTTQLWKDCLRHWRRLRT